MNLSLETEKRTVQNARRGDPRAFQTLYEKHSKYVYRRCLRLTRDPHIAEDLTQEVFIQVWKKLAGFRGDSLFKTWLYQITTNIICMHFRQLQRHSRMEQFCEPEDGLSFEEILPSSSEHPDGKLLLHEVMSVLTPGYRAVLVLHDLKGYKHDEIAVILGVPSGTSKSNLYRARLRLRQAFAGTEREASKLSARGCGPRNLMKSPAHSVLVSQAA
jgi:RNA polymerase sigma-70 factor, ECF subfamily